MTIQVNPILTKTRNPKEHGFKLENQSGQVVHIIDDGFILVKFEQFMVSRKVTVKKRTEWIKSALEWYVHQNDLV